MKKFFISLCIIIICISFIQAQTTKTITEGEYVAKTYNSQRFKTECIQKNFLVKWIVNGLVKKNVDNNPNFYSGNNDMTIVFKENKTRITNSFDQRVEIKIVENGVRKTTVYYPSIKKGYYSTYPVSQETANPVFPEGTKAEKTGKTTEINGHACEWYSIRYTIDTTITTFDSLTNTSTPTTTKVNCKADVALCTDLSLPNAEQEVLPGIKGIALKSVVEAITQTSSPVLNVYGRIYTITSDVQITERSVDDSEFEVPADIKLVDINQKPGEMIKIIKANKKYLMKKGLWNEVDEANEKVYDSLDEEWDF